MSPLESPAEQRLRQIERALKVRADPSLLLRRAHCLLSLGRVVEARTAAMQAWCSAPAQAGYWDALGTTLSRAGEQHRSIEAYDEALKLHPDEPRILFNRAAVRRYTGDLAGAEADYDRVIALNPGDYEAYKNRSDLRPQTPASNHVRELETLLCGAPLPWMAQVHVHYALAKEYEDLGQYPLSFTHLTRAAQQRRAHLRYEVCADEQTVDWIIEAFDAQVPPPPPDAAHADSQRPVFIVGLPRSGSTLVDRILDRHPDIHSAGELPSFALTLVELIGRTEGGSSLPRRALIDRSATMDFEGLGRHYLRSARAAGAAPGRFTDKMPLNFLYCGLIRRALPGARIVHVTREPMDACYAMYKTLFDAGYPFSYEQIELGRYYAAYHRLMRHWQSVLPGAIHEVRYESLVTATEHEIRKLLAFCGLPWHPDCLAFHENPAPTITASAAQVRRPLYQSSLGKWKCYEDQLAPMLRTLRAAHVHE